MNYKKFSTFNFQLSTSKGFTLIELLIVIAILGVLAASLLAFIDPFEQLARTRDAGRKSAITQLGSGLNGKFLSTGGTAWQAPTATWIGDLITSGEIKTLPIAGITTTCTAAANVAAKQLEYCNKISAATAGNAIIFTLAESKSEKSKCTGASEVAYILWTSVEGSKTGIYCSTTEPAAATTTFNLK